MNVLKNIPIVLFISLICAIHQPSYATKVKPLNLKSITKNAHVIFEGECVEVRSGEDPETGLMATWYTFRIKSGLKGKLGDEFTFKQFGGTDGDITVHVPTVTYQVGEKVVLFLYGKSEIGFSSCVGMNQGKFYVKKNEESDVEYVTNGMPAMLLFKDMPATVATYDAKGVKASGAKRLRAKLMERDDFLETVKQLVQAEQEEAKE